MFYLAIIFSAINTTMLTIMYFLAFIFFLLIIIMYYSIYIFLFLSYVMLCIIYCLVLFWGGVLLFVGLVLSVIIFLAFVLDVENNGMLIVTFFLAYILLMWNVIFSIDLIIFTVNYVMLSTIMIIGLNYWAFNLWERHSMTPLDLIWCLAEITIDLLRTSEEFRCSVVKMWLILLFLKSSYIPVIEGVKVIDAIVFDDKILMNHYIALEMQEYTGAFNDICSDKLLMNIDQIINTDPVFTGRNPDYNPIVVDTFTYNKRKETVTWAMLQDLSNKADLRGFFYIREINMRGRSCVVDFYGPVPNWNDTLRMDLLKELHSYFPYGDTYEGAASSHTLHDPYRTEAYIAKRMDDWKNDPNVVYISDQRRPAGLSPYYDPDKKDQYKDWKEDISNSIIRYTRDHGTRSVPKLDAYSEIFLASFRNAHDRLSPTHYYYHDTMDALKS